jgi:hypothetical protein
MRAVVEVCSIKRLLVFSKSLYAHPSLPDIGALVFKKFSALCCSRLTPTVLRGSSPILRVIRLELFKDRTLYPIVAHKLCVEQC